MKCMENGVTDFTKAEEKAIEKIVEHVGDYFQVLNKWNLEDWSQDEAKQLVKLIISQWFEVAAEDSQNMLLTPPLPDHRVS